jgi:hypothetical protein
MPRRARPPPSRSHSADTALHRSRASPRCRDAISRSSSRRASSPLAHSLAARTAGDGSFGDPVEFVPGSPSLYGVGQGTGDLSLRRQHSGTREAIERRTLEAALDRRECRGRVATCEKQQREPRLRILAELPRAPECVRGPLKVAQT